MRTLDDIVPPSRRQPSEASSAPSVPPGRHTPRSPRGPRFPFITIIVLVLVLGGAGAALFHFSGAEVNVTPTSASAAVSGSFSATQSSGELPFEVITAEKVATQSVNGSGTKEVKQNASGTITIYNTQAKAQKLIATTRFATPAGLIFRIRSAVTVPAGSTTKPGSIQATVYADQPGDSYNVAPTSFSLPGLAGSAQASQVYAKSTSAMTGGASGTIPVVDSATEAATIATLKTALTPDLMAALEAQIPAGYVLLPGAATTAYSSLTPAPAATTGMVDIKVQGTITAVVFPDAAISRAIAASVTGLGYQGQPITLASTEGITFSSATALDASSQTLSFDLSGTASLVYSVDSSRIASAVAGKTRSAAEVALTNYPEVKRAVLILRPFWKSTFPEDPAQIKVVTTDPK